MSSSPRRVRIRGADIGPSPGWGGVESPERLSSSLTFTPTLEQVRIAPRSEALSGGQAACSTPIKGEG
jgi:hypothetical protein